MINKFFVKRVVLGVLMMSLNIWAWSPSQVNAQQTNEPLFSVELPGNITPGNMISADIDGNPGNGLEIVCQTNVREAVAQETDQGIYLLNSQGDILWSVPADNSTKSIAVGNLIPEEQGLQIVYASENKIFMLNAQGKHVQGWENGVEIIPNGEASFTRFTLADFDEDGNLDIIATSGEESYVLIVHNDGEVIFREQFRGDGLEAYGITQAVVGDIDPNGVGKEIVFGIHMGRLFKIYREETPNGIVIRSTILKSFLMPNPYAGGRQQPYFLDSAPVIGNVGKPELGNNDIIMTPDGTPQFSKAFNSWLLLHSDDGLYNQSDNIEWPKAISLENNEKFAGTPILADINNDSNLEVISITTNNSYQSTIYVLDEKGHVLPGWPKDIQGVAKGSPIVAETTDGSPLIITAIGAYLLGLNQQGQEVFSIEANDLGDFSSPLLVKINESAMGVIHALNIGSSFNPTRCFVRNIPLADAKVGAGQWTMPYHDMHGTNNYHTDLDTTERITIKTLPYKEGSSIQYTKKDSLIALFKPTDSDKNIVEYTYAVGSQSFGNDVLDWTVDGLRRRVSRGIVRDYLLRSPDLQLEEGVTYYISIKGRDADGNILAKGETAIMKDHTDPVAEDLTSPNVSSNQQAVISIEVNDEASGVQRVFGRIKFNNKYARVNNTYQPDLKNVDENIYELTLPKQAEGDFEYVIYALDNTRNYVRVQGSISIQREVNPLPVIESIKFSIDGSDFIDIESLETITINEGSQLTIKVIASDEKKLNLARLDPFNLMNEYGIVLKSKVELPEQTDGRKRYEFKIGTEKEGIGMPSEKWSSIMGSLGYPGLGVPLAVSNNDYHQQDFLYIDVISSKSSFINAFTVTPESGDVEVGQTITLKVDAESSSDLEYEWYEWWPRQGFHLMNKAKGPEYSYTVRPNDVGLKLQFKVIVTNSEKITIELFSEEFMGVAN